MSENEAQMPQYQCHKKVWALKIKRLDFCGDGSVIITPYESGYGNFHLNSEYAKKHHPMPDGYYVVYDDGYKSYSPAKAFEDGYTRI